MKLFYVKWVWVLFMITPLLSQAQQNESGILFRSGPFMPEKNIMHVTAKDPVFVHSLFQSKHYVIIQFNSLPSENIKEKIKWMGIQLKDYLPRNAYSAVVPQHINIQQLRSLDIRSIFLLNREQKTQAEIYHNDIPAHAIVVPGYVDISILTFEEISSSAIAPALEELGAVILEETPMFRNFVLRVKQDNIAKLADLPFVQWMETIEAPKKTENLLGRSLHRVNVLNDGVRNLKGNNIHMGIWDGGEVSPHIDFSPSGRVTLRENSAASSHSTHCAGTITGRGIINPKARGMAPNANLYSFNFNGNIQTEMANAIVADNLIISSHSYGSTQTCTLGGAGVAYSNTSRNTDLNLNNFPSHLHVHSAGNDQSSCTGGWYTITGSGKSAKNNIVVANITSTQNISGSSSFGPVHDGRIKPEISAFGTGVLSTYTPLNTYGTISGTSMATPGIAGSLALLVERYKQLNSNAEPISALIKNIACNGALDLGNTGPDYKFGFGRINALAAVKILEDNRYVIDNITQGGTKNVQITVPPNTMELKIMLTWNDPAGTANAAVALVNDLDLTVIDPSSATTLPWTLNANNPSGGAFRAVDTVSNIEQITISNPAAGTYTLRVNGKSIAQGPNQQYALTWIAQQPQIEVTYPNGNEKFHPGDVETITWDNPGIFGNQVIEYSLNNGTSWTNLTTVGPLVTRFNWTVPSANTSTALIRITSGAISDVSDANFNILNKVTGLTAVAANCISGALEFSWNAVANATHYDLFKLDPTTGEWVIVAADIVGTTVVGTGLIPNTTMWFTIVAKNNTTNAVSERANAISRLVTSTTGGLGTLSDITGNASICNAATGITYSVQALSGSPVYNWTVPTGATIQSGQGTTSILVNFSGPTTGAITVFASLGGCQSTTSSLAITPNNSGIAAPVSGGNQTQATCASNPLPTLTATATVPAGHSIVWYSDATGNTVVANPTLNSIGDITYYAASKNTATGCESTTRTAVTLTITETSPATISINGSTQLCTGETVTLTASAGDSYVWSNGATSNSITVGATGNYSVTVTVSGCSSTSAPVAVQMNTAPTATITASGPLSFCNGESVTLTASAAASYTWSTGATTQSLQVSNSGNFSVTVENAAGCSNESAPVTVSVTPQPTVVLQASPYTSLHPGLTTTITANVTPPGTYIYEWEKDGDPIANSGNSLTVHSTDIGAYQVKVTSSTGGCDNISSILQIGDSASNKLFIFPNPNTGQFYVSYYNADPSNSYSVTIYDAKGAKVFTQQYPIGSSYENLSVNLKRNSKGVYRVMVTDRNGNKLASGNVVVQ